MSQMASNKSTSAPARKRRAQLANERLFEKYFERLVSVILQRIPRDLQSILDAEDVAQDAMTSAFRDFDDFENRGEGAFWAWLTGIAENRLADAIKRARRDKRGGRARRIDPAAGLSTPPSDPLGRLRPVSSTPSRSAARRELSRVLRAAMEAHLSESERRIVELRHMQHLDWPEIGERIGRTAQAVRSIDHRALKKLKEALGRMSRLISRR